MNELLSDISQNKYASLRKLAKRADSKSVVCEFNSHEKYQYMGRYTVSGSGADCKSAVIGSGGSTPSLPTTILGCSQAARHGTLTPAFDSSNLSTPAIYTFNCVEFFYSYFITLTGANRL